MARCPTLPRPPRARRSGRSVDPAVARQAAAILVATRGAELARRFLAGDGDALDFALETLGLAEPGLREWLMQLYLTFAPFPEGTGGAAPITLRRVLDGDPVERNSRDARRRGR